MLWIMLICSRAIAMHSFQKSRQLLSWHSAFPELLASWLACEIGSHSTSQQVTSYAERYTDTLLNDTPASWPATSPLYGKNTSFPENCTKAEMLSAPEDSRCVYQHGEPQLLRYKTNNNQKNLVFFFFKLKCWGGGGGQPRAKRNGNVHPLPQNLRSGHTNLSDEYTMSVLRWSCFHGVRGALLPGHSPSCSTGGLPLGSTGVTAAAVPPRTDAGNMLQNINSAIQSA